jgi:ribosomal protein L11 methyltransferase
MQSEHYHWIQGPCPYEEFELFSWQLFEKGAPSVEEVSNDGKTVVLKISTDDSILLDQLCHEFPQIDWERGSEENRDWNLWWRDQQKAIDVCPGLRVRAPWVEVEPNEDTIDLILEAKSAFGTGSHESTRLAAQLLQGNWPKASYRLLDIGTGTGILSMFAEKASNCQSTSTEIDPLTSPCLEENFRVNVLGAPRSILGPLEAFQPTAQFDVVVANMIRSEVWPLRHEIRRLIQPGGLFVVSGQLTATDRPLLLEWWKDWDWQCVDEMEMGEWWAACVRTPQ